VEEEDLVKMAMYGGIAEGSSMEYGQFQNRTGGLMRGPNKRSEWRGQRGTRAKV